MSKTIQIPVHMPLTLPDNWQDCTTAQQLAYWILAEFEEFKVGQATKEEIATLSNAIEQLSKVVDTKVAKNTTVAVGRYAYGINNTPDGGIIDTVFTIDPAIDVPQEGNIVVRSTAGNVSVPETPTYNAAATSKKYVDAHNKEVSDACHANTVAIGNINTTISGLNSNITEIQGDVGALQADVTQLQGATAEWINNPSNVVSSTAMFQTVTAVNNKVTVSDSLFTTTGHTIFVMVKGITTDIVNGKVFEKTGATVNYDSNVREIDVVSAPQNPVFLINCFIYSGHKILNVSTLSAFV